MNQGLSKIERLKSRKQITSLFSKNEQVFSYPFKILYAPLTLSASANVPAKLLVSVSKRTFKRAVDRNRMKRLIREAYRKNKGIIYHELQQQQSFTIVGILFVGKELMNYQEISKGMNKGLNKLRVRIAKQAPKT